MTAAELADALEAKQSGPGFLARCPAHDDRTPSLSITEGEDGRILIHCFAGCSPADVVQAMGLTLADLFPRPQDQGRGPSTHIPPATKQALETLQVEATVLAIAAGDLASGKQISQQDLQRLDEAAKRVANVREVLYGRR